MEVNAQKGTYNSIGCLICHGMSHLTIWHQIFKYESYALRFPMDKSHWDCYIWTNFSPSNL